MSALTDQGLLAVFVALAIAHALADFPLQGAYLVKQKSRQLADGRQEWIVALSAHCLIQAGGVWLVTGSMLLGGVEFVLHAIIDTLKSEHRFGLLTDQALHLLCKLVYAIALAQGVV